MEFPYEIHMDRRIIIVAIIILIIIIIAFLLIYKPVPAECGNGIVDFGEECDRSICPEGFYCGTECKCVAITTPAEHEKRDCSELGGFLCDINEVCKGDVLDAKQLNCCSIECSPKEEGEEYDVNEGADENVGGGAGGGGAGEEPEGVTPGEGGGEGGEGAGGEEENGEGGIEYCQTEGGEIGFECSQDRCFGQFEDGCCVGVCADYDIQGFTECFNLCIAQGIYSEAKCEELCSP